MKSKLIFTIVFLILISFPGCSNKNVVPVDKPNSPDVVSEAMVIKE